MAQSKYIFHLLYPMINRYNKDQFSIHINDEKGVIITIVMQQYM